MSTRFVPPSPDLVRDIRALAERRLTPEEFDAYVAAAVSEEERRGMLELIDWFARRYPTPRARLAYARRAYANAKKRMPPET